MEVKVINPGYVNCKRLLEAIKQAVKEAIVPSRLTSQNCLLLIILFLKG